MIEIYCVMNEKMNDQDLLYVDDKIYDQDLSCDERKMKDG
jgi:hypothetical protein